MTAPIRRSVFDTYEDAPETTREFRQKPPTEVVDRHHPIAVERERARIAASLEAARNPRRIGQVGSA